MDIDAIVPIMCSGLRKGEEEAIVKLIAARGLPAENITPDALKHFMAARKGNEIVGVLGIAFTENGGLLHSLAVVPKYRERDAEKKLLSSIQRYALSMDVSRLYMFADPSGENFAQFGFQPADENRVPDSIKNISRLRTGEAENGQWVVKEISKETLA